MHKGPFILVFYVNQEPKKHFIRIDFHLQIPTSERKGCAFARTSFNHPLHKMAS